MNEKIEVPTMKVPPLKKICMTIGQLPASYVESMSYYEMLIWFVHYLRDDIIPVVNANGEATKELQELYVELQDYVNNYFDSTDFQEMVNNKLDEMVEDGTLQNLINNALRLISVYETYSSLISDNNLVDGLKVKTLGYYSINDGGGMDYLVTTTIPLNKYYINIDDTFYLIPLFKDYINVLTLGFYKDGLHDNTSFWNNLLQAISLNEINHVVFPEGTYLQESYVMFDHLSNITFDNYGKFKIKSQTEPMNAFDLRYCDNITFNNFNIESERNQIENPPEGFTRENQNGSNIRGFNTHYCNDIIFNHPIFKNMASDFFNQALIDEEDETLRSNRIIINDWKSTNASAPIYVAYINDLKINNAHVIPVIGMSGGDHILYCNLNTDNVYINNCYFEAPDNYLGVLINYRNSSGDASNSPKNLYINDTILIGRSLLSIKFTSNAIINNCTYKSLPSGASDVLICNGTPKILFNNCQIINNSNSRLFALDSNTTSALIQFKNCYIEHTISSNNLIQTQGNTGTFIDLINNEINCNKSLLYNTGENCLVNIIGNKIKQAQSDSYCVSNRKTTTLINFFGNVINNSVDKTNLFYNNGIGNNNTRVYNNIVTGYTQVANATDIATINNENNYFVSIYTPE